MSRTWKDAPYKVRQKRMMEKGVFDHDHYVSSFNDKRIFTYHNEVKFKKADAKEIHQFRQELIESGKEFTEREDVKVIEHYSGNSYIWKWWASEKTIVFTITETVVRKSRLSDYCTDVEHFDVNTGNDTRDGKIARCAPFAYYTGRRSNCGCFYCNPERTEPAKVSRKAKLNNLKKAFNNGSTTDDLLDFIE